MKNLAAFCIICSLTVFFSCSKEEKSTITLTNDSPTNLTGKAISIKRNELAIPQGAGYPVIVTAEGDSVASQLDDLDGDGAWDELFFVADIPAGSSINLSLLWSETPPHYPRRTSVRFGKRDSKDTPVYPKTSDTLDANEIHGKLGYQPYQTDGPSWENDQVGFRHYFDGRNAKDLFGKKVSYMSPDSVGINAQGAVEDNYHVMADWGRDVLAVGNSVGLGGLNLMIGDSLPRLGCVAGDTVTNIESSVFKIITEGPVRSVINYTYNNWKPLADREYKVKETTSIWPSMYAYQNSASVSGVKGDETLLIGLVNSNTPNPLKEISIDDKWMVLLTHDQQTYNREWWLGMALILPKEVYQGYGEAPKTGKFSNTFFGKLKVENDKPVTYYAVGCWELSDEQFKDPGYFENYVTNLAKQLAADVKVTVSR